MAKQTVSFSVPMQARTAQTSVLALLGSVCRKLGGGQSNRAKVSVTLSSLFSDQFSVETQTPFKDRNIFRGLGFTDSNILSHATHPPY